MQVPFSLREEKGEEEQKKRNSVFHQEVHHRHKCPKAGKDTAKGAAPLQPASTPFPEAVVRQAWLQYFNDYLRERHIITEEEWRKMRRLVEKS